MSYSKIVSLMGAEAESLLKNKNNTIHKEFFRKPTANYVGDFIVHSNRNLQVTAVIHKKVGGLGLNSGRYIYQKLFIDGVKLLQHMQDEYLAKEIGLAKIHKHFSRGTFFRFFNLETKNKKNKRDDLV